MDKIYAAMDKISANLQIISKMPHLAYIQNGYKKTKKNFKIYKSVRGNATYKARD